MVERKYITQLFINALFLFSCLSLSGHMVINLWERWILQNQLTSMKQDLYSLTESITSLKSHYDFFEAELSDVLKLVQNKKAKAYGHHSDKQTQELHRYIV